MYCEQTRSEKNSKKIEKFLTSDAKLLPIKLYGREVTALQKKYPSIVIIKGKEYKKGFGVCLLYRK